MSESESGDDDVYVVEEIRDVKTMDGVKKFLVKWEGYDEESWEPEDNILDKTLIKAFMDKRKSGGGVGGGVAAGVGGKTPSKKSRKLSDEDFELGSESKKKSNQKPKENGAVTRKKRKRVVSEPGNLEKAGNKKVPKEDEELVVDGVLPGLEPKDIIGATKLKDQIVFLVKWKEEKQKPSTIYAKDVNEKWPSLVIDFYERHFEWITVE